MTELTENTQEPSIQITPQQARIAIGAALPVHVEQAMDQAGPLMDALEKGGFTDLSGAIRRIWDGEREWDALKQGLDDEDKATLALILRAVNDPSILQQLMAASEQAEREMEAHGGNDCQCHEHGYDADAESCHDHDHDADAESCHCHGHGHEHGPDAEPCHCHAHDGETTGVPITLQQAKIALNAAVPAHRPETRPRAEKILDAMMEGGFAELTSAIRRIWDGERDEAALVDGLDDDDMITVGLILRAVEDRETLESLARAVEGK